MRSLFFILLFLWGCTVGNFNHAWSGEIEGQLLRVIAGEREVPVEDVDLNIVEDVPGIHECKITTETKPIVVTTNARGLFSSGALKPGLYHICAEFDYELASHPIRRVTAVVATHIYVPRMGVTRVTIKK